jgi:hypothetical protein
MATQGSDSGGSNFSISSDEAVVLEFLRGLPDPPTADAVWSLARNGALIGGQADPDFPLVAQHHDKQSATVFAVDPGSYKQALALALEA